MDRTLHADIFQTPRLRRTNLFVCFQFFLLFHECETALSRYSVRQCGKTVTELTESKVDCDITWMIQLQK